MTIGKKLYWEFRRHSGDGPVLLAINLVAVQREHETKAAAQRSIDMTEATSSVRFQMMQNRLHLQNYLLSGDTRDVEKMTDGEHQLSDALHHAQELANSPSSAPVSKRCRVWSNRGAPISQNPLVDKRRGVDSGNATVAELRFFICKRIRTPGLRVRAMYSMTLTAKITNFWNSAAAPTMQPQTGRFSLPFSVL